VKKLDNLRCGASSWMFRRMLRLCHFHQRRGSRRGAADGYRPQTGDRMISY
jgi:hypothetical protein